MDSGDMCWAGGSEWIIPLSGKGSGVDGNG